MLLLLLLPVVERRNDGYRTLKKPLMTNTQYTYTNTRRGELHNNTRTTGRKTIANNTEFNPNTVSLCVCRLRHSIITTAAVYRYRTTATTAEQQPEPAAAGNTALDTTSTKHTMATEHHSRHDIEPHHAIAISTPHTHLSPSRTRRRLPVRVRETERETLYKTPVSKGGGHETPSPRWIISRNSRIVVSALRFLRKRTRTTHHRRRNLLIIPVRSFTHTHKLCVQQQQQFTD